MKLARPIHLFWLLFAFFSCKKESGMLKPTSTFHKTKKEASAPIRVFSNSGEIILASTVNRFVNYDSNWISQLSNRLGYLDTIRILEDHTAKLFDDSRYKDFFYTGLLRDIRFTAKDTSTFYSGEEVYTRTLNYYIGWFKPIIFNEYIISSTAGYYTFGFSSQKEFYLVKENDHLAAPWMIYILRRQGGNVSMNRIQNKLDPGFYHSLAATDTLVLQEYSVIYEK